MKDDYQHIRHRGDGTRKPEQILAKIYRTRDEMDETLNAIEHRLTPGQLVDQGLDYLKHSGAREYVANLGGSVKTNPLPATLAGIGIAWLMATANKPVQYRSSYEGKDSGPGIGERMESAKETLHSARDSIGGTVQAAKMRAAQLGDTARQQAERARSSFDQILREHPLALGAVGLAIGALAAAMAPRTQKEDEMMGEARDRLLDQAKQAASEKVQQVKQEAKPEPQRHTAGQAQAQAQRPPVPPAQQRSVSNPGSTLAGDALKPPPGATLSGPRRTP